MDASGDAAVEAALMPAALACDVAGLPESHFATLQAVLQHPPLRAFASAVNQLVTSASGGGYGSFRAYLVDKSAKLHPLAGELFRAVLGEPCFTSSSTVLGVSNPTYSATFPDRVYVGADGSLSAETTDAQSATTADVTLFGSNNHTLYVGCDRKFNAVVVALSTLANTSITPTFQYWNGSAWATLTVTDSSSGFTKNDAITFTAPSDWSRCYKDSGGTAFADLARLYYVRIARTASSVGTPPVGTCVTVLPTYVAYGAATASPHLGIQQPPLALCRITAASTMTVTLPANIDYTRFAEPVGTESKLRLRALTPIAQNLTVTLAYVNASGSNASTAQSAWTAPAALGTATLSLTSSDALRSVRTSSTVSTSATEGVFAVEALPIRDPAV